MLELGTPAPDFELPDVVSGNRINLGTFAGKKGLLVMFICRHCPYVVHVRHELAKLGRDYADKSLGIVAISPNDPDAYPEDAPESLKEMALELDFNFPLCYDESQEVAKAFRAACTPEFYLFDENRRLVYRGQLDDSRPRSGKPVSGKDLRNAIEAMLAGRPVDPDQKPSVGCSIKWRPGNEPNW
jgi:peroxiredoxin